MILFPILFPIPLSIKRANLCHFLAVCVNAVVFKPFFFV